MKKDKPKESDDFEEQLWCICRSSDISKFMIACDKCEEWFHGACIGVTASQADKIAKFFCGKCLRRHPRLEIVYKSSDSRREKTSKSDRHRHDRSHKRNRSRDRKSTLTSETEPLPKKIRREDILPRLTDDSDEEDFPVRGKDGENRNQRSVQAVEKEVCRCRGCRRDKDCGDCEVCRTGEGSRGRKCIARECDLQAPAVEPAPKVRRPRIVSSSDEEMETDFVPPPPPPRRSNQRPNAKKDKRSRTSTRQCQGPGCVKCCRAGSKYCSEECGEQLASRRIYEILPVRLEHWSTTPCIAEEQNKRRLEKLRQEQQDIQRGLIDMEEEHKKLNELVDAAKDLKPDKETEANDTEDQDTVVCVTCAAEVNMRQALRHMEKCFQKMESNTLFFASYKEQMMGTPLFCDVYDSQMKAYCKRLKVLCEHTKEPKGQQDAVCGFPLVRNVFEETGEYCQTLKRKCIRHLGWERLRRAKVDIERYRLMMHLDELLVEERQLKISLSNRAGVLGLMLHQTLDHDPDNPILHPALKDLYPSQQAASVSGQS